MKSAAEFKQNKKNVLGIGNHNRTICGQHLFTLSGSWPRLFPSAPDPHSKLFNCLFIMVIFLFSFLPLLRLMMELVFGDVEVHPQECSFVSAFSSSHPISITFHLMFYGQFFFFSSRSQGFYQRC